MKWSERSSSPPGLERLAREPKGVDRLAHRIGGERVAERQADTAAFVDLPLVEKSCVPESVARPDSSVILVDSGRLQIRKLRPEAAPQTEPTADRPFAVGVAAYRAWISWLWLGDLEWLLAALAERSHELGPLLAADPETNPWRVVAEVTTHQENQRERIRYTEYPCRGLPLTSSPRGSMGEWINQRV